MMVGSVINIKQLLILGMKEEYLFIAMILIGGIVIYFVIQPIVLWFVKIRAEAALSYLISSLIILVVLFYNPSLISFGLMEDHSETLKRTMQCLAAFGGIVMCVNVSRYIKQRQKRSS